MKKVILNFEGEQHELTTEEAPEQGASELNDLLCAIESLDEEIRVKSIELLQMRNDWLRRKGWEITKEEVGPTYSYFYQKFGELFICEDEAIDRELRGA